MDSSNILPAFLGERDQEVNSLNDIGLDVLWLHGLFANGDMDVDDLFKLEFDGSFKSVMHFLNIIAFSDGLWGLTSLHKGSAHGSDDGLHEGVRSEENLVFR